MESWYRHFLLILAICTFFFIPAELLLTGHTEGFFQLIPFVISGISLLSIGIWHVKKTSWSLWLTRTTMIISCATSLLGSLKHYQHNLEFELDIRPGTVWTDVFLDVISGASPLLAPGILFLAGVMVLAALHKWPVDTKSQA